MATTAHGKTVPATLAIALSLFFASLASAQVSASDPPPVGVSRDAEPENGQLSRVAKPEEPNARPAVTPDAQPEKQESPETATLPATDTADAGAPAAASPAGAATPSRIPAERRPTSTLTVSPEQAAVGEPITWKLNVKRLKEDSVHLASGADFGGLEIIDKNKSETAVDASWVMETLTVRLIAFEAGDITIPAQRVTAVDADGNIADIETEAAQITVKSLIANEPEPALKEDTGQGETLLEEDYLLLWILAGLGAAFAVALLTLLARKLWAMRRPRPEPPPPPPRPAEEIAYEKLNALRSSHLLAEGELKEFHVRLSEAVREYIGNRYGFDSLERSSEELIQALGGVDISKTEYDLVVEFLGETDLVKFAKVLPTIGESEELLDQSFGFVDRTTPKQGTGVSDKENEREK